MIEPVKPGDDLFPYDIEIIDGKEKITRKKDWNDYKQVALNIRTIDYLLQFPCHIGSVALINMIEGYAMRAMDIGDTEQKRRFKELLALRDEWLRAQRAA